MARMPADQIAHIKANVSLLELVQSQGFQVSKQGKNHVVRCSFRDEQTSSCIISPKSNLFNLLWLWC